MVEGLMRDGWTRFAPEPCVARWAAAARQAALQAIADPVQRAAGLDCDGTWFVGVDCLPNAPDGSVAGSGPLSGAAIEVARTVYGDLPLHRAQVSVIHPGYPRPRRDETAAAARYRRIRDAAHVDGLLAIGPDRRRMLKERHAYILGLPLSAADAAASPFVVWQGSHRILQRAFAAALHGISPEAWDEVDLTDIYQRTRREVFETCQRTEIAARPGEAYLVHRMALHGVAPWGADATADSDGRMIAYFRPEFAGNGAEWLECP